MRTPPRSGGSNPNRPGDNKAESPCPRVHLAEAVNRLSNQLDGSGAVTNGDFSGSERCVGLYPKGASRSVKRATAGVCRQCTAIRHAIREQPHRRSNSRRNLLDHRPPQHSYRPLQAVAFRAHTRSPRRQCDESRYEANIPGTDATTSEYGAAHGEMCSEALNKYSSTGLSRSATRSGPRHSESPYRRARYGLPAGHLNRRIRNPGSGSGECPGNRC